MKHAGGFFVVCGLYFCVLIMLLCTFMYVYALFLIVNHLILKKIIPFIAKKMSFMS